MKYISKYNKFLNETFDPIDDILADMGLGDRPTVGVMSMAMVDRIYPEPKDIDRARGLAKGGSSPKQGAVESMAKLITDPQKLVRRAKAIVRVWGTADYPDSKPWGTFKRALERMGFDREQVTKISNYSRTFESSLVKHISLFEEFEEEMTLSQRPSVDEDPNPNSIQVGDAVNSYRGMGEVVEVDGTYATIRLHNSKQNLAKVPLFAITKIDPSQISSHKIRDTRQALIDLVSSIEDYYAYIENEAEYSESEEEFLSKINAEKLYELLEEVLIDAMATVRNDNAAVEYEEYSRLVSVFAELSNVLIMVDPSYAEKVDTLYANFPG